MKGILEKRFPPPSFLPSSNSHSYIPSPRLPFRSLESISPACSCLLCRATQPALISGQTLELVLVSRVSLRGGDVGGRQWCGMARVGVCVCVSRNEGCSLVILSLFFSSKRIAISFVADFPIVIYSLGFASLVTGFAPGRQTGTELEAKNFQ